MKERSQDSLGKSRAWLLQSCGDYSKVIWRTVTALRNTGYFDKFYIATDAEFIVSTTVENVKYITHLALKKDYGWSDNIIRALAYVREKTFFMGCEDHLLVDFDKGLVEAAYQYVACGNAGCVRLTRKPQIIIDKEEEKENYLFYKIDKSYRYYVSCQPTVWNKDYLESIIRPGETSWQFETLASQRAKKLDLPAGVTYKTAFNYRNLIEKGKLVENPKTYEEIHGT